MANVQGDQSVLTFSQLRQHPEAVIVAEINDKPVIFKLSQLLDQLFMKGEWGKLDMTGHEITGVSGIVTTDNYGDPQTHSISGYGYIFGAIDDGAEGNGEPKIFFGKDVFGDPARLIIKSPASTGPGFTPAFPGQMFITSTGVIYIAAGTSSASDWKKVTA